MFRAAYLLAFALLFSCLFQSAFPLPLDSTDGEEDPVLNLLTGSTSGVHSDPGLTHHTAMPTGCLVRSSSINASFRPNPPGVEAEFVQEVTDLANKLHLNEGLYKRRAIVERGVFTLTLTFETAASMELGRALHARLSQQQPTAKYQELRVRTSDVVACGEHARGPPPTTPPCAPPSSTLRIEFDSRIAGPLQRVEGRLRHLARSSGLADADFAIYANIDAASRGADVEDVYVAFTGEDAMRRGTALEEHFRHNHALLKQLGVMRLAVSFDAGDCLTNAPSTPAPSKWHFGMPLNFTWPWDYTSEPTVALQPPAPLDTSTSRPTKAPAPTEGAVVVRAGTAMLAKGDFKSGGSSEH